MKELEELRKPIVTLNDIAKLRNLDRASASVTITRWAKKGQIIKVEKGKYAITKDVFAIASSLIHPSYISFGSALYLRGLLEQTVGKIHVVSTKYKKSIKLENIEIKFVKFGSKKIFGYEKMERGKFFAFVAEVEKAVADCLYTPSYFDLSYLDAAFRELDVKKFETYILRMGSVVAIKRAGYLLELAGRKTTFGSKNLKDVHYLVPGKRGKWNREWRLYV